MSLPSRAAMVLLTLLPLACGSSHHHAGHAAPATDAGVPLDAALDVPLTNSTPDESGVPEAATDSGPFVPAPHDPAPQVVSLGGPILKHPVVVPVFFAGDSFRSAIEQFLTELAKSSYWGATTSEYGVGPLTIAPSVVMTSTPPTTSSAMDQFVDQVAAQNSGGSSDAGSAGDSSDGGAADGAAQGSSDGGAAGDAGGDAATPPPSGKVYAVFLPQGATVTDPTLGQSCVAFGGYHGESLGLGTVYAVIPHCTQFDNLSGMDALTSTLSHELIEAATDPRTASAPAYAVVDDAHAVWNVLPLGEIGDMCAQEPQSYVSLFGKSLVQLIWSNKAAAAGHDPCVPNTTQAYFNAVPDEPDNLVLTQSGGYTTQTRGVKLAVGQTRTIDVHLFSDAPRSDWLVYPQDVAEADGLPAELTLSINPQYGKNGDVLKLTITRNKPNAMGGSEFILWSEDTQDITTNLWFGYVGD